MRRPASEATPTPGIGDPGAGQRRTSTVGRSGQRSHRSLLLAASVLTVLASCSGSDSSSLPNPSVNTEAAATSRPSVPTSSTAAPTTAEPTTTSSTTLPPTTTAPPPNPQEMLGFCNADTMQQIWVGADTGAILETTDPWSESQLDLMGGGAFTFAGERFGAMSGFGPFACNISGSAEMMAAVWNRNFTKLVGTVSLEGVDEYAAAVVDGRTGGWSLAIEPAPVSDFGGDLPSVFVAAFTPNGDLVWRDDLGGSCETYRAAFDGTPIVRATASPTVLGRGGFCYGRDNGLSFSFAGEEILVRSTTFGYEDVNGNEASDSLIDLIETATPRGTVPESQRFRITASVGASSGSTAFVAIDENTGQTFIYSWSGEGSEPAVVTELEAGRWHGLARLSWEDFSTR